MAEPDGTEQSYPKHVHKALWRSPGNRTRPAPGGSRSTTPRLRVLRVGGFGGLEYDQGMEMTLARMKTEFESE